MTTALAVIGGTIIYMFLAVCVDVYFAPVLREFFRKR